MARSKYETNVKPFLKQIPEMITKMTRTQVARELGVSYISFKTYIEKYPELRRAVENGKRDLVIQLQDSLIKKALGFEYTESKETVSDKNGHETITYKKYCPPDVGAIHLLLKNYDKDNWANDPQLIELKREELQLKREMAGKEQGVIPVQIINDIPRSEKC